MIEPYVRWAFITYENAGQIIASVILKEQSTLPYKIRVWSDKFTQEVLLNRMMGGDFPGKYVSYEILSKNTKKQSNVLYNSKTSWCIWSFSL